MLYWSPTALSYLPVLLLHGVSLGYLLWQRPKYRQTWLFCGWLGGMTLMVATQCAARIVYAPRLSTYLAWWGGVGGVTLALIALLQFAYHFPRLRYPREARLVLVVSLAVAGALFVWMGWENATAQFYDAGGPFAPDAAFAPNAVWQLYDFRRFHFGFVAQRDVDLWTSFKFFDVWQILGNLWVLSVWARKTIQSSAAPTRRPLAALLKPRGPEARLARAWVLLMLLSPLPIFASILEDNNQVPPGTFALVHLLVLGAIMWTYLNYAPEPTSLMVKLVGISLMTLLIILGIVSDEALRTHQHDYLAVHQAEIAHLQTLLAADDLTRAPAAVLYVAARPAAGLFAETYRMRLARPGAPEAAQLAAHDALLHAGLERTHFPAQIAAYHSFPWLGIAKVAALGQDVESSRSIDVPAVLPSYRGAMGTPDEHMLRYGFVVDATRYEAGYSYSAYRVFLHQKALPFMALQTGVTLLIVALFPYFFRVGIVTPLARLLEAMERVDHGDLRGQLPVLMQDEIGQLTHGFNRMVTSLRTSEESLHALNLTLEQRVIDRTRDLTTLHEIAVLVNQASSPNDLLAAALPRIVTGVGADAGLVLLPNEIGAGLDLAAVQNISPTLMTGLTAAPFWKTLPRQEPLLLHDTVADPRSALLARSSADVRVESFPYATVVSIPLPVAQDQPPGILVLFGATPYLFNAETMDLLETVAKQLGSALENLRLREYAAAAAAAEERERLARDLHDSVTQLLYSQTLFADAATKSLHAGKWEPATHYLTRLSEAAHRALREMRLMLYRLRPPVLAELGLAGTLQRRLELVEQRAGIQTRLVCELDAPLADEIETTLYYIAEEALNNALKHAAAAEVQVTLIHTEHGLTLSVQDNGRGFDRRDVAAGLGLQNISERAAALGGDITITAVPGQGTHLSAYLPLAEPARPAATAT